MRSEPIESAEITQLNLRHLRLSGSWTARGLSAIGNQLDEVRSPGGGAITVDAALVDALDTAGAWLLHQLRLRLRGEGGDLRFSGLQPEFDKLLGVIAEHAIARPGQLGMAPTTRRSAIETVGRRAQGNVAQVFAFLAFVGEAAVVLAGCVSHPRRLRWRPVLYNLRTAGVDALPIVGLLSFLLGVVLAYQGAGQLRQYGANIFVVDLVGLSILREFAPLMTAIIIAGRSGSAYAAQIGTMVVTEEIDALQTLGVAPFEMLVVPKLIALVIALPLLTFFADVLGVLGGMFTASSQLGVSYGEFVDRFAKAVSVTSYLVGIGKAPVFAAIIVSVGCFRGFQTRGGADSVGRQTTLSVVQSIFLVIVADAAFSIAFSALDL